MPDRNQAQSPKSKQWEQKGKIPIWARVFHQAPWNPLQISVSVLLIIQIFPFKMLITYYVPALYLGQCDSTKKILPKVRIVFSSEVLVKRNP